MNIWNIALFLFFKYGSQQSLLQETNPLTKKTINVIFSVFVFLSDAVHKIQISKKGVFVW